MLNEEYKGLVRYIVFQLEESPHTGRLHYQWYLEFAKNSYRYAYVKKMLLDPTVHVENRKGTRVQARNYCMKEESRVEGKSFVEIGFWLPMEANGLCAMYLEMREKIKKNILTTFEECEEEYPLVILQYSRQSYTLLTKQRKINTRRFRKVTVNILLGKSGCGKTSAIYKKHGYADVYTLTAPANGKPANFIDGYSGEKILLIDEFRGWIGYSFFLNLLDGHPMQFNVKGAYGVACWDTVYITSNDNPSTWFKEFVKVSGPLLRRYKTGSCYKFHPKDKVFKNYCVEENIFLKEKDVDQKLNDDMIVDPDILNDEHLYEAIPQQQGNYNNYDLEGQVIDVEQESIDDYWDNQLRLKVNNVILNNDELSLSDV